MCVQPGDRAPTAGTERLYSGGVVLELCVGPPLRADVQYVDSSYVSCHVNVIHQNLVHVCLPPEDMYILVYLA